MKLAFDFNFTDLYTRSGLIRLDQLFTDALEEADTALFNRLMTARLAPQSLSLKEESDLLLALAPELEKFLSRLFQIEAEVEALQAAHHRLNPLYACKRLFVQRRVAKAFKPEEVAAWKNPPEADLWQKDELEFATMVMKWLEKPEEYATSLEAAQAYAAWALYAEEGKKKHANGVLFKLAKKLDYEQLIPLETELRHGVRMLKIPPGHRRNRQGFALTDPKGSLERALDEANYCIYCAHQGKRRYV